MTKVYWTMNEIKSVSSLTRGLREGLVNTMNNTGGPVELDGHFIRPYQSAQITKAQPMGMHFATPAEEAAIARMLGEDQVIEGEVVEITNPWPTAPTYMRGHAIPADAVLEARADLMAQNAAWTRRATVRLLNARRKKGRNLTDSEIHDITRSTK